MERVPVGCWPMKRELPRWLRVVVTGDERRPALVLIGLMAAASVIMLGYKFNRWDQLLYLCFVDRYFLPIADHPGDLYLANFLWRSYTTFWMLIFPLKSTFGWEWPLFVIYVATRVFLYWGVWGLAFTLTGDRRAAWLSTLLLLMNNAIVGGLIQLYMPNTITRHVVIPFFLFGLRSLWERRYVAAAVQLGLGFQVHVLSAAYWFLAMGLSLGADLPRDRRAWTVFGALTLPLVAWFAATLDFAAPEAGFRELVQAQNHYIFFGNYDSTRWKILLLTVFVIAVAARHMPATDTGRRYVPFTLAVIGVLVIHFVATDVFFFQPIAQLQMIRIADVLGILAMIGAAQIIAVRANGPARQRWVAAILGAVLLVATVNPGHHEVYFFTAMLLVCLLGLETRPGQWTIPAVAVLALFIVSQVFAPPQFAQGSLRQPIWNGLMAGLLVVTAGLMTGWFYGLTAPCLAGLVLLVTAEKIYTLDVDFRKGGMAAVWKRTTESVQANIEGPGTLRESTWVKFQIWARDHTPPGTLFMVPPGVTGFRVFSERSVFYEIYDSEPCIFQPAYAAAVSERMKFLDYWPQGYGNAEKAARTYHTRQPGYWRQAARKWGVRYVVTNQPVDLPFPKLYQCGPNVLWEITTP